MDAGTAFALGFLAGWWGVCLLQFLWKLEARIESQSNLRYGVRGEVPAGKSEKIIPPKGGSGTAPPKVGPQGGSGTSPPLPPPPIYPPMRSPRSSLLAAHASCTWTTNGGTTYVVLPWDLEDPPAGNPVKR